jgi:hypothetical protein
MENKLHFVWYEELALGADASSENGAASGKPQDVVRIEIVRGGAGDLDFMFGESE